MTILHITPSYKPAFVYGGPIYSVAALCEAQVKEGNNVFVYTTNANGVENLTVELKTVHEVKGVDVIYFQRITKDHTHISPSIWLHLWKNAKKYDIIHLHSWWSILMIGCAWILYFRGVRFIISPRGMFSSYTFNNNINPIKKKIFFHWLSKPVLKNQIFHSTALSEQKEIVSLFSKNTSVFTLPNLLQFPDLETQLITTHIKKETINLLYVSRIDPKKGIEFLLKAIQLLKAKGVKVELSIIGSGDDKYQKELVALASILNISNSINWKGSVEWSAKFNDILNADLLVLPSYNENFANIVLETLYAGRPVIITKYVGLSSYVSANNMGWVIDTNPNDIVDAVQDYISKKVFWQSKSLVIHEKIKVDFNQQVLVKKYIESYKHFLKAN